jgi:hypothetical protein
MVKHVTLLVLALVVLAAPLSAQQTFRLPDVRSMKHLTSKQVDRAPDIPGNETTVDYYAAPTGEVITVYSYRGNRVAFSTHMNNDIQKTYRLFMDLTGTGLFQEINRGTPWTLPPWSRQFR